MNPEVIALVGAIIVFAFGCALVVMALRRPIQMAYKNVRIIYIHKESGRTTYGAWYRYIELPLVIEEKNDLAERNPEYAYRLGYLNYPDDAVQCGCFGSGCATCNDAGWLPAGHPKGRLCQREECKRPLPPPHGAVYCSSECACTDA